MQHLSRMCSGISIEIRVYILLGMNEGMSVCLLSIDCQNEYSSLDKHNVTHTYSAIPVLTIFMYVYKDVYNHTYIQIYVVKSKYANWKFYIKYILLYSHFEHTRYRKSILLLSLTHQLNNFLELWVTATTQQSLVVKNPLSWGMGKPFVVLTRYALFPSKFGWAQPIVESGSVICIKSRRVRNVDILMLSQAKLTNSGCMTS